MRELARVRAQAARLRASATASSPPTALVDDALRLLDRLRANCAELEARCARLERQLTVQEEGTRQLFDVLPHGIVATDTSGVILDANRAACVLLARSRLKLASDLLLHFVEDRDAFSRVVRELPNASGLVTLRARVRPSERAPFDASVTALRDPRSDGSQWLWLMAKDGARA